ncbi:hypothetical protein TrLO_g7320 [Triparma laevis f. longispina]|uniref:Uncharacterized protein n=1 Tax=Triparma laevis f. longispina TaxID=1714387 RepID=A0A9W6ZGU7_9STRA|nr:hypothetical protein TrLO_g7320 [Triparma laevis f. longispina]
MLFSVIKRSTRLTTTNLQRCAAPLSTFPSDCDSTLLRKPWLSRLDEDLDQVDLAPIFSRTLLDSFGISPRPRTSSSPPPPSNPNSPTRRQFSTLKDDLQQRTSVEEKLWVLQHENDLAISATKAKLKKSIKDSKELKKELNMLNIELGGKRK